MGWELPPSCPKSPGDAPVLVAAVAGNSYLTNFPNWELVVDDDDDCPRDFPLTWRNVHWIWELLGHGLARQTNQRMELLVGLEE